MKKTIAIYCVLLLISASTLALAQSFESPIINDAIKSILPPRWKIVEIKNNEIPWGHYWSTEYKGKRGQMIIIEGPCEVSCKIRDKEGKWHSPYVAKETIELWIMPSTYKDTWKRFFDPHRPKPAKEIFGTKIGKIYGQSAHRLIDERQFKELLKNVTEICWPDSPVNNGKVSWRSWQEDIKTKIQKMGINDNG